MQPKIKTIAIHLPQFYPFAENDAWWGKGFTEWTNVTKAKPLFKGHRQPHLPTDLGFYDLRLPQSLQDQADLADAYGIDGFCFYHYWFNGKRLLEKPLDNMLATGKPAFPFMLCWANENWTRTWDGNSREVLMKQEYNHDDDRAHIRFLCEHFFSDHRYIKVDGKPFFLLYRPGLLPDIKNTLAIWREEALRLGIGELHLGYAQSFGVSTPPADMGFDCAFDFQPNFRLVERIPIPVINKVLNKLHIHSSVHYKNNIISYPAYAKKMAERLHISAELYPGITPMWDNTARRTKDAYIFIDSSPEAYGDWLKTIVEKYKQVDAPHKFIFLNAWNEWAEGNHLEPCRQWGKKYLEATREALLTA